MDRDHTAFQPDQQQFVAIAEQEAARYFDIVLPSFIHLYYRGAGYEFLWRMLEAHDHRNWPVCPASAKAKRMSDRVRRVCPVEITSRADDSATVLGRFSHAYEFKGGISIASRRVRVFSEPFADIIWPDAMTLRREVFRTIFHEYIHYFESFLLRSEQPLRGREQDGSPVRSLTIEQARRLDTRAITWQVGRWAVLAAILAALIALVVAGQSEGKAQ